MIDPDDPHAGAVFDFVDLFYDDRDQGLQRPLSSYLLRFPGHEDAVAREYLKLVEKPSEDAPHSEPLDPASLGMIGPYRLLAELGRGGQGRVYLAEDTRIQRRVALKLLPGGFVSEARRGRLRREAEAIARLDHPGLCAVLEAQIEGDSPFLAMRYVEGATLAQQWSQQERGPVPWRPTSTLELHEVLRFFERAARALHAAHEAGVLHRDIKPGNLMVTPRGDPVVLDFGLAQDESSELELTQTGESFGTLDYMAPEQLEPDTAVDRRCDVHALGLTLFEAIGGKRAFEGKNRALLMRKILAPARPNLRNARDLRTKLGDDVHAVLTKAMSHAQEDRYPTALALAEDLARIRQYEPIRARPVGPAVRLRRWIRREPRWAGTLLGILVALGTGLAIALGLLRDARVAEGHELQRHRSFRAMEIQTRQPARALAVGIRAMEDNPDLQCRSNLLALLQENSLEQMIRMPGGGRERIRNSALHPDGEHIAILSVSGQVALWLLGQAEPKSLLDLKRPGSEPAPRFSQLQWLDESTLGLLDPGGQFLRLRWDRERLADLDRWAIRPGASAFTTDPESQGLLIAGRDWAASYDLASHASRWERSIPRLQEPWLAISGPHLLVGERGRLRKSKPEDGGFAPSLLALDDGASVASLERDGVRIAWTGLDQAGRAYTASEDGYLRVMDLSNGEWTHKIRVSSRPLLCAAMGPDDDLVAVSSWDQDEAELALVELGSQRVTPLEGHYSQAVVHLAFDSTGQRLATAGLDQASIIWDVPSGEPLRVLRCMYRPDQLTWSSQDQRLITQVTGGSLLRVWRSGLQPHVFRLKPEGAKVRAARFAERGLRLVTGTDTGRLLVWDSTPGPVLRKESPVDELHGFEAPVQGLRANYAGEAGVAWSSTAWRQWNIDAPRDRSALWRIPAGIHQLQASEDCRRIVVVDQAGQATFYAWEGTGYHALGSRHFPDESVTATALSADGERFAWAGANGRVHFTTWDARKEADWQLLEVPQARLSFQGQARPVADLDLSADGRELAVLWYRSGASVFDLDSGQEIGKGAAVPMAVAIEHLRNSQLAYLHGRQGYHSALFLYVGLDQTFDMLNNVHVGPISAGAASSCGDWVANGSQSGSVAIWEAGDDQPFLHWPGSGSPVEALGFEPSPNAERLWVLDRSGQISIIPRDPLPVARAWASPEADDQDPLSERRLAPKHLIR